MDVASLRSQWDAIVSDGLNEATLIRPQDTSGYVTQGKEGVHSEHLDSVLA